MKRKLLAALLLLTFKPGAAQTITQKLERAYQLFVSDTQMTNAISSLYVIDARSGKVVFNKNSRIGLAPASTQKIITAATAFELLGKDFRYKTSIGEVNVQGKRLLIAPSGDPTLGSWRWESTTEAATIDEFVNSLKDTDLKNYEGIVVDQSKWSGNMIPDGWTWQDIGNYYGAGAQVLNWRENQYDLVLRSGDHIGAPVSVVRTIPTLRFMQLSSQATAAARGTGDNAYIYLPLIENAGIVRGTIPVNQDQFKISGSIRNPDLEFIATLEDALRSKYNWIPQKKAGVIDVDDIPKTFYTHSSPPLDSIIYWFLQRSINLYGEALVKTISVQEKEMASTDSGVVVVRDFWKQAGLDPKELNMYDGSGLSPLNRVTTHAQVEILKYARSQKWFSSFYNALPSFNGMKMKSGTINDVKGYCGYHRSAGGNEYIFSFLVNNYNGRSSTLVNKMFRVLDVLK